MRKYVIKCLFLSLTLILLLQTTVVRAVFTIYTSADQNTTYVHLGKMVHAAPEGYVISLSQFNLLVPMFLILLVLVLALIWLIFYIKKMKRKNHRIDAKTQELILKGIANNEFKMFLQFIVDNKTRRIVSAEALSRWARPDGLVGPGQYIKDMEVAGLISNHDFYIFELVCKQLERWKGTAFDHISISCNFTRITLSEDDFIVKLKSISDRYQFDHSKLSIEITEDAMEKNIETATSNVLKCKDLGFHIFLDDIGSGYTSLSNLCDYPLDVVKIDRDILLKATTQPRGMDLFSGIIALAHVLNLAVICEGVETPEHLDFVSSTECDYIQGWYFSKPIPAEESERFVTQYNKLHSQPLPM